MSEEAAFLEALKANPADDTARLVFADWLDEYGEPAKAAYLRAVVDLAQLPGGSPDSTDAAERLYDACHDTEAHWRETAGARFDVRIEQCTVACKILAIKVIREVTGFGLAEAKAIAESVRTPLFSWLTFEQASPVLLAFHRGGLGQALTREFSAAIRPSDWPAGVPGSVFDVVLSWADFGHWSSYAISGIARLLNVTAEETAERLRRLPLVVGRGLHPTRVAEFLRQLNLVCNVGRALPPGSIRVVPRLPAS